jgi:exopolyphosphatase/guanosine-5'-triphosphate,3'-diphosphate pyrophosphatase
MRVAAIDLGTNTVRLLVADVAAGAGDWRPVLADQRVTRLGEGLAAAGRLVEPATRRTADAVAAYVEQARAAGAARLVVVATSAVREAANGAAFTAALERRTGVPVQVISGDEEARLTLAGVRHGLDRRPPESSLMLVFDIGGGSTEFILARGETVLAASSLRLGVVPLAERFPFDGPVDWPRYNAMAAEIRDRLAGEVAAAIRSGRPERLVGTAGTVTTLAALDLGLAAYDPGRVQGHALTRAAVERLLARFGGLSAAERGRLPCLEPGRADLIVAGTAIVLATMTLVDVDVLVVSDAGLREGILAQLTATAI